MAEVIVALLSFLASNIVAWIIYERTRRRVYLYIFIIGNWLAFISGLFILTVFILWKMK